MENVQIWTHKQEKLLQKWKFESSLYIWLHNYNAEYYKLIDKLLGIPALVINAITTTTLFSILNIDNNQSILISIASLLIIGTVLQSVRDFLNISKLIHSNINTSKQYQILMNDIIEQLNQETLDRINPKDFITKINKQRNNIVIHSPYINNKSWNKLTLKIKNGDFILLENNTYFKNYFNELVDEEDNDTDNNQTIINLEDMCDNISVDFKKYQNISLDTIKNKLRYHQEEISNI